MTRRPRSLTAMGVAVLLLATVAAAALSVGLLLNRHAVVVADTELEVLSGRAHALALGLKRSQSGEWLLQLPRDLAARFDPAYGRSFYAVLDGSGRIVASSMASAPGEVPLVLPNSELEEPTTFLVRRGGMALRGASIPIEVQGTTLVVQVADNVRHPDIVTDDLSDSFPGRVSWVVLPVFAALAAVAFGTLRLCMRPIERLSERAAALSGGGIGERLPEDGTPREIQPLVRAMNAALDRAERTHAAQRGFTAEAAHQVRRARPRGRSSSPGSTRAQHPFRRRRGRLRGSHLDLRRGSGRGPLLGRRVRRRGAAGLLRAAPAPRRRSRGVRRRRRPSGPAPPRSRRGLFRLMLDWS